MTDSVPAPMVQIPAETVEALREIVEQGYVSFNPHELFRRARRLVDAATPAGSVPAADILALADEWEQTAKTYGVDEPCIPCGPATLPVSYSRKLRALVAAAEQADKGEADDTPRDECDHALYTNTHRCTKCGDEVAPAVPVGEPLCRCGHTDPTHGWHANRPCNAHGCRCAQYEPRVPVNDEAEADGYKGPETPWGKGFEFGYNTGHQAGYDAGFRAARGEDA